MQEFDPHVLDEKPVPPPQDFSKRAHVKSLEEYRKMHERALQDPETFWGEQAKMLDWFEPPARTLEWNLPHAKWFVGGKLNVSYNCLDRHLQENGNKPALLWEAEDGAKLELTYAELHQRVCRMANALESIGVKAGDAVTIYLPMIPELTIAMLACARIGAVHSVIFGGFSAQALIDRIGDSKSKLLITADGGYRRGKVVPLKETADLALPGCPTIEKTIVVRRTGEKVGWQEGRDLWWHELEQAARKDCPAIAFDSEQPLFILYTSGTTGKPKGVLHTSAGYLLQTMWTARLVFDLQEDDVYWCTADIGWVTGHSYVVYGPLANAATVVMYEGAPDQPRKDRFWEIIDRYKVTILYTSPTAIRAFMAWGLEWIKPHDLSSLRLLGSVGEPINPAAWRWYSENIGKNRCPIIDTWWQTETGAMMISPLPGATPTKPGSATLPLPGIDAKVVNLQGQTVRPGETGYLTIQKPWPSMLRTIYGDDERYKREYWSRIPGAYFAGDAAQCDNDGYIWVLGRVDDVIKVAGHRLSSMEIESVLVSHPSVAEAAVVARPDEVKGEAIVCFVTLRSGEIPSPELRTKLMDYVAAKIGTIARPTDVRFADLLPKTRSGKIMRRLLRELAHKGGISGDTTTLEDLSVIERIAKTKGQDDE
ncbi:MAG TPA: acetate--CoA ligase [Candidatus Acidoferrales bacterium]|jgi:acetyl-CoA synthetase|nr:acetate--CoA ligase [Candidatus Acidoferrales bacterium]